MPSVWEVRKPFLLLLLFSAFWSCEEVPQTLFEKESFLQINGSEVYVKEMAMGATEEAAYAREPLIIVHGGPVMDHSYFLPYFHELAESHRLIFYDQRACGQSSIEVDRSSMSLDGFVADIELLRKALNLDKINLLGHSWGGMLAMKYGIKHADRLDKLILSNSMAPSSTDWQKENVRVGARVTQSDIKAREALMSSGILQSDDPREGVKTLLRQSFKYQMYDTANLDRLNLFIPLDYMARSQVFGLLGPGLSNFDLYSDLNKITCPTLLVYGETEHARDLYTDKMLSILPKAQMEIVTKAGHFPFVEQQAGYNDLIKKFLKD